MYNNRVCVFDASALFGDFLQPSGFRVRAVIAKMRYDALIRREIIPNLTVLDDNCKIPAITYPKVVKETKRCAIFGMFMEHLLKKYYAEKLTVDVDYGHDAGKVYAEYVEATLDEAMDAANALASEQLNLRPFSMGEFDSAMSAAKNAISFREMVKKKCLTMVKGWKKEYGTSLQYNVELKQGNVTGHPDLISQSVEEDGTTETIIWDVKCSATTKQTRQQAYLQILAYWALHDTCDKIGLILPMCGKYILYDLHGYDRKKFRHELIQVAKCMQLQELGQYELGNDIMKFPIGHHIENDGLLKSILGWVEDCYERYGSIRCCQVYSQGSRNNAQSDKTVNDLDEIGEYVKSVGLHLYFHAPLAMNIGGLEEDKVIATLRKQLQQAKRMNGKGVVVHTGRLAGKSIKTTYATQAKVIRACLKYATDQTKLLLESPCGNDGDTCETFEAMNSFFLEYFPDEEERKVLGICVDSCHLFVAGYSDPAEYVSRWLEEGSVSIGLCHFNDSKSVVGACRDLHYPAFRAGGAIGYERMTRLAEVCLSAGIDMVIE